MSVCMRKCRDLVTAALSFIMVRLALVRSRQLMRKSSRGLSFIDLRGTLTLYRNWVWPECMNSTESFINVFMKPTF